ncbi:MAG: hypothetical protein ACLUD2_07820 [Clostridium sp.]
MAAGLQQQRIASLMAAGLQRQRIASQMAAGLQRQTPHLQERHPQEAPETVEDTLQKISICPRP